MREGAYDYMTKPVDPRRLRVLVEKAVEKVQVNREVTVLRRQLKETRGLGPLLGASPAMQEVYRLIEQAAPSPAPVLILGRDRHRQGAGRARHPRAARARQAGRSWRSTAPRSRRRCSRASSSATRRARSPARSRRRDGRFELADGGTLFLDEIGELPLARAGQAPARAPGAAQFERVGGNDDDQGRRAHRRRHQPGPRRGDAGRARSARTSTTGSTSSPSRCRRCASGARTSRCSSSTSSREFADKYGKRVTGSPTPRSSC